MKRFLIASLLTLPAFLALNPKGSADCRFSWSVGWNMSYERTGSCRSFYYHSEPKPLPPMCTSSCYSSGPACASAYPVPVAAPAPAAPAAVAVVPPATLPAPTAPAASGSGSSGYTAPMPSSSDSRTTSWAPYARSTQPVGYSYYPQSAGAASYPYGAGSTGYAAQGSGASFQAPSYWYGE